MWYLPYNSTTETVRSIAKLRGEWIVNVLGYSDLRYAGKDVVVRDNLSRADAHAGEMKVRVSDELRKPIAGFDYDDMPPITCDSAAHEVKWKGQSLDSLKGKFLRLEFQLHDADLYTFRAAGARRLLVHRTVIKSTAVHPPCQHEHIAEEAFCVLEGRAEYRFDGSTIVLADKPNIRSFLADDLGYVEIGQSL